MQLFIRIKDGQPFEHPILEDNFREAFPNVDINNLPLEFARFERINAPMLSAYEVYEGVTYEWVDGIVKDVHRVRPMTSEEKIAKQNAVKSYWAENGFASWVFNEDKCLFEAPISFPHDGNAYDWDENLGNWVAI